MMRTKQIRALKIGLGVAAVSFALGMAPQSVKSPVPGTDHAKLADTLVNTCAGIKSGEIVWIEGGTRDAELLENLAIECRKIGGQPFITLRSDRLDRMMVTEVPTKYDA